MDWRSPSPCATGDRERFHNAARDILWSFSPVPPIKFSEWEHRSRRPPAPGWTQYAAGTVPFHGPIVRMGCVSYPIDPAAFGLTDWPWRQTPIMFEAEIGSLSVQASRKSLSYDQRTIDTLSACLKKFEIDYIAGLQADVDAQADLSGSGGVVVLAASHAPHELPGAPGVLSGRPDDQEHPQILL